AASARACAPRPTPPPPPPGPVRGAPRATTPRRFSSPGPAAPGPCPLMPRRGERGPALDRGPAGLAGAQELEVDEALAALVVALRDLAGARQGVAGPHLLTELDAEPAHIGGAGPVGRGRGAETAPRRPTRR